MTERGVLPYDDAPRMNRRERRAVRRKPWRAQQVDDAVARLLLPPDADDLPPALELRGGAALRRSAAMLEAQRDRERARLRAHGGRAARRTRAP